MTSPFSNGVEFCLYCTNHQKKRTLEVGSPLPSLQNSKAFLWINAINSRLCPSALWRDLEINIVDMSFLQMMQTYSLGEMRLRGELAGVLHYWSRSWIQSVQLKKKKEKVTAGTCQVNQNGPSGPPARPDYIPGEKHKSMRVWSAGNDKVPETYPDTKEHFDDQWGWKKCRKAIVKSDFNFLKEGDDGVWPDFDFSVSSGR